MKRYKVLKSDLMNPFKNFQFEIGKQYFCDDFDDDESKDCSNGFYATKIEGVIYSFREKENHRIFECDVSGRKVEIDNFKCRYEKFKLVKEISYKELKKQAREENEKLGYNLSEILFPINPLMIKNKGYSEKTFKKYLKQWDSTRALVWDSLRDSVRASLRDSVWDLMWASVGDSMWDSLRDSVRASLRDSVWDLMWASVGDSMWDSVGAYISSFFPNIKKWEYVDSEVGENPFESVIKLWKAGYLVSFDGTVYRIHTGEKAEIVYEIRKDEL